MNQEQSVFLNELHKKYGVALYKFAMRRLGNHWLAQDVVQEVFVAASSKVEILQNHENPGGWLMTSLSYAISNENKKKYHTMEITAADPEVLLSAENEALQLSLELLLPTIFSLDEIEILILRFEQNLDYDQIAKKLKISETACRKRLSRAIAHYRDHLQKMEKREEIF